MIRIDTFVSLEQSLTDRLTNTLAWDSKVLFDTIEAELKKGDYDKASELANTIDLTNVVAENKPYISWITNLAMLFGASLVTSRPGTTVVALGHEKDLIAQAVTSFADNLAHQGSVTLREQALQLIAQRKELETAPVESVEKADDKPVLNSFDPNKRILLPFDSFMDNTGKAYFNMVSSLHTSRVSAYGFTAEADALGMTTYQINEQLDLRICNVCALMHGKKFKVVDARRTLDVVLRVTSKDDLKALQPWPSQSKDSVDAMREMTPEQLVAQGWHIPPFHPRCRGLLARVGKSPSLDQIKDATVPEQGPYTATQDDFSALGHQASPEDLSVWNSVSNVAPAEVAAALQTKPLDEYLEDLVTSDDSTKASGVNSFSFSQKKMSVGITTEGADALILGGTSTMKITSDLPSKFDQLKDLMQAMYTLSQDMDLNYLSAKGTAASGFHLAKGGFVPDLAGWNAVKADINNAAWYESLAPGQKAALADILQSESSDSIYDLADLGKLGELALKATAWQGYLPVDDPDAIARFLDYFGG